MRILYEGSLHPPGVSGVTGPALRETSCINRSLAALSDVLGALAEGRGHIPYRNSRLTRLLQDPLGTSAPRLPGGPLPPAPAPVPCSVPCPCSAPSPCPLPLGLLLLATLPKELAGSGGLCLPPLGFAALVNAVAVSRVVWPGGRGAWAPPAPLAGSHVPWVRPPQGFSEPWDHTAPPLVSGSPLAPSTG